MSEQFFSSWETEDDLKRQPPKPKVADIAIVKRLEAELAAVTAENAKLRATNAEDLKRLTEAVELGSKQAGEFDRLMAEKDAENAKLRELHELSRADSNHYCRALIDVADQINKVLSSEQRGRLVPNIAGYIPATESSAEGA